MNITNGTSWYLRMIMVLGLATAACGNNIVVTNVALSMAPAGYTDVQFDLSWSNSWRATWTELSTATVVTNWDAAWVFVKFRANGDWVHATLAQTGHTAPAGVSIDPTSDGKGALIHRSTSGSGDVSYTNGAIKLRWNYAANGVVSANLVDVSVEAIEMVYVPSGSFYVGSGGSEAGSFYTYPTTTNPYLITNEAAITVGTAAGNLYYATAANQGDASGPIPALFPKGYTAFYCMKYEVTQGQIADFLNKLTVTQAAIYPNQNGNSRYTISGSYPNFVASAPDRACNWLTWGSMKAYAAWAGLRPMTELEFEKACRGVAASVPNECAWGTTNIVLALGTSGTDGSGTETATPGTANCNADRNNGGGFNGPVRAGIFATAISTRELAGASYWGAMEMSGNLFESLVTAGNSGGRNFAGSHGTGALSSLGVATNADWPTAGGLRGGCYSTLRGSAMGVSDRTLGAYSPTAPDDHQGFRAVRTAP
ncbi:MAG: SUMF1/EgtB/PvdO family nonheme iron enzyme [bacterium]